MSQVENPLLGKFRELLLERGVAGIKSIGVYWSLVNRRESSAITIQQFYEGIINHNMNLTPQEVTQLFGYFDRNGNGTIDYDEFLLSIRVVVCIITKITNNLRLRSALFKILATTEFDSDEYDK